MANTIDTSKELFGRRAITTVKPITADMCILLWASDDKPTDPGKTVLGASNVSVSYQQQVVRRRTLATAGGHPLAVIYPTQPIGSLQIQRLFADFSKAATTGTSVSTTHGLFDLPGWDVCNGTASISMKFSGQAAYPNCTLANPGYRMTGATVASYNIAAEAEGMSVADNVSVEFLQMFPTT